MSDKTKYVRYMTEKVVKYLDRPADHVEAKQVKKMRQEPWLTRWFGIIPMGMQMWWRSAVPHKRNKERTNKHGIHPPH